MNINKNTTNSMNKNKSLKRKKSRASTSSVECASYRATLKRTFRFLTVLLVMLVAGSTGAWAQSGPYSVYIPVQATTDGADAGEWSSYTYDENWSNIDDTDAPYKEANEKASETTGGSATAWSTDDCLFVQIIVYVNPKPGYSIKMSDISILQDGHDPFSPKELQDPVETTYTPYDPAENPANAEYYQRYDKPRQITIYSNASDEVTKVKVNFIKSNTIALTHTLGSNAKVTFFDGGTTEPSTATFDPTSYTETSAIASIDNSDGNDRYIIAHIVPETSYWTDAQLLFATDETTAPTGSTPAGARSASVLAKAPSEGAPSSLF